MDLARRNLIAGMGAVTAAAATPLLLGHRPGALPRVAPPLVKPLAMPPQIAPTPAKDVRRVLVHNLHTGDALDAVYFENGQYVTGALSEAMRVLRDWRNGEEHYMDPRLFDLMHGVRSKLEVASPFQIISGYRSPESNAAMHARSHQVAEHSQHMLGKALDVRVEGVPLERLHQAALSMGAGGVGFYPVSGFVHMDVGRVRTWSGT
jgi:uncharacterized protein YcbK (DUF882 family)